MRESYNNIYRILTDSLCTLLDFRCALTNSPGFLVHTPRGFVNFLGLLVYFIDVLVDPPGLVVDVLLYRSLSDALDRSPGEVHNTKIPGSP